jgi:formylmethanofuran dehydrogenase subunit E
MDLKPYLDAASSDHKHLCPRQILGVRIGLKGMSVLGLEAGQRHKNLLVISETDGCFVDGVIAATKCSVGHRTLRVEDYGKIAATFVDIKTGRSVRVAPTLDVRQRASLWVPEEKRRYFAQLKAYQIMPDEDLMTVEDVDLNFTIAEIVSHSGRRTNCEKCGEEIINEREIVVGGKKYCHSCAHGGYYRVTKRAIPDSGSDSSEE